METQLKVLVSSLKLWLARMQVCIQDVIMWLVNHNPLQLLLSCNCELADATNIYLAYGQGQPQVCRNKPNILSPAYVAPAKLPDCCAWLVV